MLGSLFSFDLIIFFQFSGICSSHSSYFYILTILKETLRQISEQDTLRTVKKANIISVDSQNIGPLKQYMMDMKELKMFDPPTSILLVLLHTGYSVHMDSYRI